MEAESKGGWGWIAFGVGLAACVIAGGVLGAMLGQEDGSEGVDSGTVAALALDARGLSEDARSLSSAFESALVREALEGEAATLRTELQRLDRRAARIRAQARAEVDAARGEGASPAVLRGLRNIRRTVNVFERDVVGRLESVVDAPALWPDAATVGDEAIEQALAEVFEEALADVTLALDDQDRTLATLAESLERADGDDRAGSGDGDVDGDALLTGSFRAASLASGQAVTFEYELGALEPEIQASGAERGEAEIVSAATGRMALANAGAGGRGVDLPGLRMVLFWRHADLPVGAAEGLSLAEEGVEGAPSDDGYACRYEIEGERHCALVELDFGEGEAKGASNAAGELVTPPEAEVVFDAPRPAGRLTVVESAADSVAELIESRPPELVEVLADDTGEDFAPACMAPVGAESEIGAVTLGLLDGDGEVIFESADTDPTAHVGEDGHGSPPECYAVSLDSM